MVMQEQLHSHGSSGGGSSRSRETPPESISMHSQMRTPAGPGAHRGPIAASAATTAALGFKGRDQLPFTHKVLSGDPEGAGTAATDICASSASAALNAAACAVGPRNTAEAATGKPGMEDDVEIAAQKQAARAKLAELEGKAVASGPCMPASSSRPGAAEIAADNSPKKEHNRHVPAVAADARRDLAPQTAEGWEACLAKDMQPCSFSGLMRMGLLLCMVLLLASWVAQVRRLDIQFVPADELAWYAVTICDELLEPDDVGSPVGELCVA